MAHFINKAQQLFYVYDARATSRLRDAQAAQSHTLLPAWQQQLTIEMCTKSDDRMGRLCGK
jgi:hypothetical protein